MSLVRDLLAKKGSQVLNIGPAASVFEAALMMNEHRLGALVVEEAGNVLGIFTERDLLRRVVAERLDPEEIQVGEVMTTEVICCSPETTVEEARGVMRDRRIRHLPVSDGQGQLHGLISIGDLNAQMEAVQKQTVFHLTEYIHGRV